MARGRRWLGGAILVAFPVGAAAAVLAPGVRGPAARTFGAIARDVLPDRAADVRLPAPTTRGVSPGAGVFLEGGAPTPVAHVVAVAEGALTLRFEPGADRTGPWTVKVFPPSDTLEEALALAVPPATAEALRRGLETRARRVWRKPNPIAFVRRTCGRGSLPAWPSPWRWRWPTGGAPWPSGLRRGSLRGRQRGR